MNEMIDQLDDSISDLLAGQKPHSPQNAQLRGLMQVVKDLRCTPNHEFPARLRAELERGSDVTSQSPKSAMARPSSDRATIIPPLFSIGTSNLPIRGSHLALSFALHAVVLVLVGASGWLMVEHRTAVRSKVTELIPSSEDYVLPFAPGAIHGGGGGGDQDKLPASHGTAPRFANEQLTPPAIIVRNEAPKLPAEPTLIGPPDLVLPQSDKYGDSMANILNPPSNGTGSGGGIGSGHGGGIGSGEGPGIGEGRGGGIGGGVYHVGGGVSAPRPIYDPDPEYSDEAIKAKYQGSVVLIAIIDPDGRPRDLRVSRSLGMGLDQKALDAVWKWRFTPAMKDNRPVSVQVCIEVVFHMF
jgi:TonB family protein